MTRNLNMEKLTSQHVKISRFEDLNGCYFRRLTRQLDLGFNKAENMETAFPHGYKCQAPTQPNPNTCSLFVKTIFPYRRS